LFNGGILVVCREKAPWNANTVIPVPLRKFIDLAGARQPSPSLSTFLTTHFSIILYIF
jgi:hypothetical protein